MQIPVPAIGMLTRQPITHRAIYFQGLLEDRTGITF